MKALGPLASCCVYRRVQQTMKALGPLAVAERHTLAACVRFG